MLGVLIDIVMMNCLKMLRDMFVVEFRTFVARVDAFERRAVEMFVLKNLCLNLFDLKLMLKKKFNIIFMSVFDLFDVVFEYVVVKVKTFSIKARVVVF